MVTAATTVFAAPPDFAPDRRPFLSLADELNDRAADAITRSAALTPADRDAWVENLFERIQETVALLNVDLWRQARATTLTGTQLTPPIPRDRTLPLNAAMGGRDALRNSLFALAEPSTPNPLPLTGHARMRHRVLSDLQALRDFARQNPGRLRELVRGPFEVRRNEDAGSTTMAMPPFMRNSNALPLTLSVWQYELLMKWVADTELISGPIGDIATGAEPDSRAVETSRQMQPISAAATQRRRQVLERMRAGRVTP